MTTIKEVLDKFNPIFRYNREKVESLDIGDYTFDEAHMDKTGYVMEFTSKINPDVWLRINDDRISIQLIKRIDEKTVDVNVWRMGKTSHKQFSFEEFRPFPENERIPLPTRD